MQSFRGTIQGRQLCQGGSIVPLKKVRVLARQRSGGSAGTGGDAATVAVRGAFIPPHIVGDTYFVKWSGTPGMSDVPSDGEQGRQGEEGNATLRQEYIGWAAIRQGGGLKPPRKEKTLTISRKDLLCLGSGSLKAFVSHTRFFFDIHAPVGKLQKKLS